jgi:hypothetical protein
MDSQEAAKRLYVPLVDGAQGSDRYVIRAIIERPMPLADHGGETR